MSTIMTRSGAKTWWRITLPYEVAYLYKDWHHEDWQEVTYKELLDKKIVKQQTELEYKRRCIKTNACYIWVFYNKSRIFNGWYLYVKTLHKDFALTFRNRNNKLLLKVMNLYPCGILPLQENFNQWAEEFARIYHHKGFKRKIQGLKKCYCILDEWGNLSDIAPCPSKNKPPSTTKGVFLDA